VAQLHDLRLLRVQCRQLIEGLIQHREVDIRRIRDADPIVELHFLRHTRPFGSLVLSRSEWLRFLR
jgi:hypothetical protein